MKKFKLGRSSKSSKSKSENDPSSSSSSSFSLGLKKSPPQPQSQQRSRTSISNTGSSSSSTTSLADYSRRGVDDLLEKWERNYADEFNDSNTNLNSNNSNNNNINDTEPKQQILMDTKSRRLSSPNIEKIKDQMSTPYYVHVTVTGVSGCTSTYFNVLTSILFNPCFCHSVNSFTAIVVLMILANLPSLAVMLHGKEVVWYGKYLPTLPYDTIIWYCTMV